MRLVEKSLITAALLALVGGTVAFAERPGPACDQETVTTGATVTYGAGVADCRIGTVTYAGLAPTKKKAKFPACKTEDSTATPCVWNASEHGNGRGLSFQVDAKGKRHFSTPDNTMALKACENEDGPGACYWFADEVGNGVGHSFWIDSMACFHYLRAADDKRWGDHNAPCDDPYEMDKTARERSCQDAAVEGAPGRMNARFAECHRKYGKH